MVVEKRRDRLRKRCGSGGSAARQGGALSLLATALWMASIAAGCGQADSGQADNGQAVSGQTAQPISEAASSATIASPATAELNQGIRGKIVRVEGAFLEDDLEEQKVVPIAVPVHVFRGRLQPFDQPNPAHPSLVTIVQSDRQGQFTVALPPGEYTLVAEIDAELYLNNQMEDGSWATTSVKPDQWRNYIIEDVNLRDQ